LAIAALIVAYLILITEKMGHKCIEIERGNMSKMMDENKLNKNTLMLYKIFQDNPFGSYSIDDIIQIAEKDHYAMSQRTIFRAIDKLANLRKIYCVGTIKGHRKFQLSNTGCLDLICNHCGTKVSLRTMQQSQLAAEIYERYKFDIIGFTAEYYGTCSCTRS
jgi:Fe2+ or Zn2+ uptake regulation protein